MGTTSYRIPRGIRNRNPFNIRKGPKYVGLSKTEKDSQFCVFDEMKYGCRAMWKLLVSYRNRFKESNTAFTIANIIKRFAPPNENDTDFYAMRVSKLTGLPINRILADPEQNGRYFLDMLCAMASIENGWSMERVKEELLTDIKEGYRLAYPNGTI